MAPDALLVAVAALAVTLLGGAAMLAHLFRRVRRSLDETAASYRRLEPRLERFQQDGAVRARELERLAAALDRSTPPDSHEHG